MTCRPQLALMNCYHFQLAWVVIYLFICWGSNKASRQSNIEPASNKRFVFILRVSTVKDYALQAMNQCCLNVVTKVTNCKHRYPVAWSVFIHLKHNVLTTFSISNGRKDINYQPTDLSTVLHINILEFTVVPESLVSKRHPPGPQVYGGRDPSNYECSNDQQFSNAKKIMTRHTDPHLPPECSR